MIVYDSVDEQLVTRHVDSDVRSTEPSVSYRIDVYENSHETNDIGQVGTVEPPVLDPLNVDQTNGAGLETPQGVNVVNHDAIEANDIKCELTLDTYVIDHSNINCIFMFHHCRINDVFG